MHLKKELLPEYIQILSNHGNDLPGTSILFNPKGPPTGQEAV
jgi:hypothetical protein